MGLPEQIDTLVIVMLENRSFDHLLGYLSLDVDNPAVDGLRRDQFPKYVNLAPDGAPSGPWEMPDIEEFPHDIPHDRHSVGLQIHPFGSSFRMDGFVKGYCESNGLPTIATPAPMGYLTAKHVPVTDFLARRYGVCDRWFAPIPAGTFPNRFVSMSGFTPMEDNGFPSPTMATVLDWLDHHKVPWRVYCEEFSFFAMIAKYWGRFMLSDNFKRLHDGSPKTSLEQDFARTDADFPRVVFVEPNYESIHPFTSPNDNHPPLSIGPGEEFLSNIYEALTRGSPERWKRTLVVITYDEHGGFFDHYAPRHITMAVPAGASYTTPWASTGPRVPALLVSPLIPEGSVFSEPMDHTSILQSLAAKFAPADGGFRYPTGMGPALDLDNRGVALLWDALSGTTRADDIASPPAPPRSASVAPVRRTSPSDQIARTLGTQIQNMKGQFTPPSVPT
jgi:phospholipase C